MGSEIERKFLLRNDNWRAEVGRAFFLRQGYLAADPSCAVRVRVRDASAWLTVKGRSVGGCTPEFEYAIPLSDAVAMLELVAPERLIEKKRHEIRRDGLLWEVDEFYGANAGLILAEVELASPRQEIPLPPWIGAEVTGDARYYNATLASRPFRSWQAS